MIKFEILRVPRHSAFGGGLPSKSPWMSVPWTTWESVGRLKFALELATSLPRCKYKPIDVWPCLQDIDPNMSEKKPIREMVDVCESNFLSKKFIARYTLKGYYHSHCLRGISALLEFGHKRPMPWSILWSPCHREIRWSQGRRAGWKEVPLM